MPDFESVNEISLQMVQVLFQSYLLWSSRQSYSKTTYTDYEFNLHGDWKQTRHPTARAFHGRSQRTSIIRPLSMLEKVDRIRTFG